MTKSRAILVVDVQNLFYSARDIYGLSARISFRHIYERCREKYNLIDATAYVAVDSRGQSQVFCDSLRKAGYRAVTSQLKVRNEKIYERDWNVGITISVIKRIKEFDILILASRDRNYSHLLKHIQDKNKKTVVMLFKDEIDQTLEKFANEVMYLEEKDIFYQAEK